MATSDKMTMPFGRYKGRNVLDCPRSYLSWLLTTVEDIPISLRQLIYAVLAVEGVVPTTTTRGPRP